MAAAKKRGQWLLGGALALTLGASAWVSQFDEGEAEANAVSGVFHPEADNSSTMAAEKAPPPPQPLRYSDSVMDLFATPLPAAAPPVAAREFATSAAPPLPFSYMGRVVEGGSEMIFLATAQRNYMARDGDLLENDYRIDSIGNGRVQFTYLPLNTVQTLAIGELE